MERCIRRSTNFVIKGLDGSKEAIYGDVSGDSGYCCAFVHIDAVVHRREDNSLDGASMQKCAFLSRQDTFFVTMVLMASTNITSIPSAQNPKTKFKTMHTPSMGTVERSSDLCIFQRIWGGVVSQEDV